MVILRPAVLSLSLTVFLMGLHFVFCFFLIYLVLFSSGQPPAPMLPWATSTSFLLQSEAPDLCLPPLVCPNPP